MVKVKRVNDRSKVVQPWVWIGSHVWCVRGPGANLDPGQVRPGQVIHEETCESSKGLVLYELKKFTSFSLQY